MNAVLIMCHKNAEQVLRLIKRCKTETTDIIIHADINMSTEEYACLTEFCSLAEGVYLTNTRIHGVLDHRSLVDIVMLMLEAAKQAEAEEMKKYQYYLLMSGQDYLIKSMQWIEKELEILYPLPLIDCTPWSRNNWVSKKFSKNTTLLRYREWISRTFTKEKTLLWYGLRGIGYAWRKGIQFFHISDYDKLTKMGVKLFGGSAWWILPDAVIDYIYKEYQEDTNIVPRLLKTYTPEETFFQIMTMRSSLKEFVPLNEPNCREQSCKTWAFFSDSLHPFRGHPYTITLNEYEMLASSSYWIARKFDELEDQEVLNRIDRELLL